jgi:hypothetical protein
MILPTKRLPQDRALLTLGAEILGILDEGKTVSRVWDEVKMARLSKAAASPITFDWFSLALAMLFMMGAISIEAGKLRRANK